ncbi:MAG: hypothetical protein R2747_01065 [Pyrinomonadaceae bacterium]
MLIKKSDFEVYADYHQFYLEDENASREVENMWSEEEFKRMLGAKKDYIYVGTARYETVPVIVEIHDSAPVLEIEKYSRINECSLRIKSEKLVLSGCTEYWPDAPRIEIEPAIYRVRILYGNLETVKDDWEGDDFYILQLWKDDEYRGIEEIKREKSPNLP